MNHDKQRAAKYDSICQTTIWALQIENIKQINIKNRTYQFFQWLDLYWRVWLKLTKNEHKIIKKHWHLLHWTHHNKKLDHYEKIYSKNPLYLIIGKVDGFFQENTENK